MYQPSPSAGLWARPLRPPAPAGSLRTAVKLMYAGAAVTAAWLITGLALIITDIQAAARGNSWAIASPRPRPHRSSSPCGQSSAWA